MLLWLNAAVYADLGGCPGYFASWAFKGARDVRFAMWVSMLEHVGLSAWWRAIRWAFVLGMGGGRRLVGDVPRLGGARAVLFYCPHGVAAAGLWKYPRRRRLLMRSKAEPVCGAKSASIVSFATEVEE